jgi:ribosomal protein L32
MAQQTKQVCPNCGASLDPKAHFCAKCGTPVQPNASEMVFGTNTNEEVVGCKLNSIPEFTVGLPKRYDLYFTDRRMVVLDLGRDQAIGRVAGGLLGKAIAKRSENKEREKRASLSLDELIALNPKDNFAIPYHNVQSMKLTGPNLLIKGTLEVKTMQEQKGKSFALTKDEYKALKAYLSKVSVLGSKLQVK